MEVNLEKEGMIGGLQEVAESVCPLTAVQAATIIHALNDISKDQVEIKATQALLQLAITDMRLENARQTGFKQGAGFWFKAGAAAMVVSIGSGFLMIVAIVTGKVDIATLFIK